MDATITPDVVLPPGLYLPLETEPVSQFKTENYSLDSLDSGDYYPVLEFGQFVVALAVLGSESTGRVSFMPTKQDIREVHSEGYGVTLYTIEKHGGITKLQSELGYYPRDAEPESDDLIERIRWLHEHVAPNIDDLSGESSPPLTLDRLIFWASKRNLLPGRAKTMKLIEDVTSLKKELGIFFADRSHSTPSRSLYEISYRLIEDNGGVPPTQNVLRATFIEDLGCSVLSAIKTNFRKPLFQFWEEFGFVTQAPFATDEHLLAVGLRESVRQCGTDFINYSGLENLSKLKRMIGYKQIKQRFGLDNYHRQVRESYEQYLVFENEIGESGVDIKLVRGMIWKYETFDQFEFLVSTNLDVLKALSDSEKLGDDYNFIRGCLESGFNLATGNKKSIYDWQLFDFVSILQDTLGLNDEDTLAVLSLVPRVNAAEALETFRKLKLQTLQSQSVS